MGSHEKSASGSAKLRRLLHLTDVIRMFAILSLVIGALAVERAHSQVPTLGAPEARAFHFVITVEEKEQILGVVAAPSSVLWVVAPSDAEAAKLTIADVAMTLRANSVRFDEPRPKVTEVWRHTERRIVWKKPVSLPTGLKLSFADAEHPVEGAYKISLAWDAPNWKYRDLPKTDDDASGAKRIELAHAPEMTTETTINLDERLVNVKDSYQVKKTNRGLVIAVNLEADGLKAQGFDLPVLTERSVQEALAGVATDRTDSNDLITMLNGGVRCFPSNSRTILVLSRPQILRAALVTALEDLQTDLITAAMRPRPPYDVFVSFERAYRAATLLTEVLGTPELSTEELKVVRLALANATLFFRNLHLWTSRVQVPLSGPVLELQVFFPKGGSAHFCAPTHALLYERLSGGRAYLGNARVDRKTGILELDLDAELAVDPFVFASANDVLAKEAHRIEGRFTDWTLFALRPETPGLRSARVTNQTQGRLAVTLGLEIDKASTVLWQLATAAGMPLRFRWEAGAEGTKSTGEIAIPFSLGRRFRHALYLDNHGKLQNGSDAVVSADYVQIGGKFRFPKQAGFLLLPKQTVDIRQFFETDGLDMSNATLPSTAVTCEIHNPLDEFIQDDGLSEQITIRNLLPAVNENRTQTLRFVEAYVVQLRKVGSTEAEDRAGPFKLAPYEADGNERSVSFLKRGGKLRYRVEARAYYSDGQTDFKPITTDETQVNLSADLLSKAP
jgi:hypothetical protein